jgi:hypothetical protein
VGASPSAQASHGLLSRASHRLLASPLVPLRFHHKYCAQSVNICGLVGFANIWDQHTSLRCTCLNTLMLGTRAAGARIHTHLWARTTASNVQVTMSLGDSTGAAVTTTLWTPAAQLGGRVTFDYQHFPLVSG